MEHTHLSLSADVFGVRSVGKGFGQSVGICHQPSEMRANMAISECEGLGSAYGIRTRDLHLERVVSLATRRMRHATDQ